MQLQRPGACLAPRDTHRIKRACLTACHAAAAKQSRWARLQDCLGATPLVQLQRLGQPMNNNVLLAKLESSNITGSITDRAAWSMINEAEAAGHVQPGGTLIAAFTDNMCVSLAMAAAIKGYQLMVVLPQHMSEEREALLAAYGAQLVRTPRGMEDARELAAVLQARGEGWLINPYTNPDNPLAHLRTTGPELWSQTAGQLTHLIAPMSSAGTAMGCSAYLKAMNPAIQIVGVQPTVGAHIPGMQRWDQSPPSLYQACRLDHLVQVTQFEAELAMRVLARSEGILSGPSAGAAVAAALRVSSQVFNAMVAVIVSGQGHLHLSTPGLYGSGESSTRTLTCQTQSFWSTLQCMVAGFAGPHYVLFLGADDLGSVWCANCDGVAEAVQQAVTAHGGTLLVVHVGSKADWSQASQHALRADPQLQLRMLPTLMHWKHAGPARRAAGDLEALLSLVHSTAAAAATSAAAAPKPDQVYNSTVTGTPKGFSGGAQQQAAAQQAWPRPATAAPAPAQAANNILSLTTSNASASTLAWEASQTPLRARSVSVQP